MNDETEVDETTPVPLGFFPAPRPSLGNGPRGRSLTGRAAARAARRGLGQHKPLRSRITRQTRKRRTGGVK